MNKAYMDYTDVKRLFHVGEGIARKIIREIRTFNGYSPLPKGKVLISEYENWAANRGKSNAAAR